MFGQDIAIGRQYSQHISFYRRINLRKVIVAYDISLPAIFSGGLLQFKFSLGFLAGDNTFFTVRMKSVNPSLIFVEIRSRLDFLTSGTLLCFYFLLYLAFLRFFFAQTSKPCSRNFA